ncbi:hypothetical protein [Lichenifustis flavocetrariae]|uniref:Uncharacterized protein n=1 Tax=Lichenifustis flavocetrariae TaxID=2949735 RepID=A0AA42CMI9_9HYPH|nr:hypothetical protein [Lichenifustis flavocetrariae]MCW6508432.1 hypothetical protein [Lichenifustis flavocetrariae]
MTFEGNFAIYCRANERDLVTIRVLHGARNVATLAARGRLHRTKLTSTPDTTDVPSPAELIGSRVIIHVIDR